MAGLLIASLEDEPDEGVEEAWAAVIDRRAKQLDSGEVSTIPWEEVLARLFGQEGGASES